MNFYELGENMKNATSKDIYFSQFSEKKTNKILGIINDFLGKYTHQFY